MMNLQAEWIDPELENERPFVELIPIAGQENNRNPAARVRKVEHRKGASYVRTEFSVDKKEGKRFFMRASAHGIYDVYLNGKHVDGCLFAPMTTQYDKRLFVQEYDVTGYFKEGNNRIAVSLGDGWYRGCVGNSQDINTFGDDLAFLCQIEDGSGEVILRTDGTWEAAQDGPLGQNDLMRGEFYDARREENLTRAEGWHPVTVRKYGYENLLPMDAPPICEHETFAAKLLTTPSGSRVLDFGQNFAGYVRLRVSASGGEKIILTHGETLDENGEFTTANFQNPAKPECDQRIEYICKPGMNVYAPTKCYFGFRYVKLETELPVTAEMFTGVAVYSDMRETASFWCGDERVNQLFRNTLWSMKSNFVGVPTDCPTREKSGFTGDAQVFCDTALYLMDAYPVLDSWLEDVAAAALPDGGLRQIAPDHRTPGYFEKSAGWCDAIELIPWRMWKRTGDISYIENHYDDMKAWMDFCVRRGQQTREENRGRVPEELLPFFMDDGFCWGEWLEPGANTQETTMHNMMHGEPETATAFFAYGCRAMGEMAEAVGKNDDAAYYKELSEKARAAYRGAFLPEGRIAGNRQCLYVRPLFMGLLDSGEREEAAAALAEVIRDNGYCLNTGFLSTGELCRVLTDYCQTETAYSLLLQEACPGWLYPVAKGATTIWESWDGIGEDNRPKNSLNHYALGAVCGWLMDSVCGIRIERGRVTVAPHPDRRLGFAQGRYESPMGMIEAGWKYGENECRYTVTLPDGLTAEVVLPDGTVHTQTGGTAEYSQRASDHACF